MSKTPTTINTLVDRMRGGDQAAARRVFASLHAELRRKAAYYLRQESPGGVLQPTALVHDAYVKIFSGKPVEWRDRAHLLASAARQMRLILVDEARRRQALKRGDTLVALWGTNAAAKQPPRAENILILHEMLEQFEAAFPRAAQVVELRIFSGLTEAEIAILLEVSPSTVKKDWTFGSAWLRRRLQANSPSTPDVRGA